MKLSNLDNVLGKEDFQEAMDDWLLGSNRSIGLGDTAAKLNNPLIKGVIDTPRDESA